MRLILPKSYDVAEPRLIEKLPGFASMPCASELSLETREVER